jgi:hypothetical protein
MPVHSTPVSRLSCMLLKWSAIAAFAINNWGEVSARLIHLRGTVYEMYLNKDLKSYIVFKF